MKTTKRVLSIALALALGLAVMVPAAASELTTEVKKSPPPVVYVLTGETLTLEIDTVTKIGDEICDVEYIWFASGQEQPIATGPKLEVHISKEFFTAAFTENVQAIMDGEFKFGDTVITYTVVANRIYEDAAGEAVSEALFSYNTKMYMYPRASELPSVFFGAYRDLLGSAWWLAIPFILGQIIVFMPLYIYRNLWVLLGR